jgi:hypothetical protein
MVCAQQHAAKPLGVRQHVTKAGAHIGWHVSAMQAAI